MPLIASGERPVPVTPCGQNVPSSRRSVGTKKSGEIAHFRRFIESPESERPSFAKRMEAHAQTKDEPSAASSPMAGECGGWREGAARVERSVGARYTGSALPSIPCV